MNEIDVALAPFLSGCSAVTTLGIRPCMGDYPEEDRRLMRSARCVFFPTLRFVNIFQAIGKPTFPSSPSHHYPRSRVLQELLFQHLKLPHPRGRIYFGKRQKRRISDDFCFPLLLMGPGTPGGTVHVVHHHEILEDLLRHHNPVVIRQYTEWEERIRVIFVQFKCVGVLRLVPTESGSISFEPMAFEHLILRTPLDITRRFLPLVHLDDVAVEWGLSGTVWQLLSLTLTPVRWPTTTGTVVHHAYISDLIQSGFP
jgi:hypothetical protein